MSDTLSVMAVIGSLHQSSVTKVAVNHVAEGLRKQGAEVDVLDLSAEPLPLVNTDTTFTADYYGPLKERVKAADVFVLGTPDYHGSVSGALKKFTDQFLAPSGSVDVGGVEEVNTVFDGSLQNAKGLGVLELAPAVTAQLPAS